MIEYYLDPKDVWRYFQSHKKELEKTMVLLGENTDTGFSVFLTEDDGYPFFVVTDSTKQSEDEEGAITPEECEKTVRLLYKYYIEPAVCTDIDDDEDYDINDMIFEREDEMICAVDDLVTVFCGNDYSCFRSSHKTNSDMQEILDEICCLLADKHHMPVYRPTLFTDDNGEDCYVEYPYNPGYKETETIYC